tara:strand:+ start:2137 stop:2556 length:420 start_codon:yes stop_codon:yes gene_type:complete
MSISLIILCTPVVAYLIAGSLKFFINSYHKRSLEFSQVGMGGFPSTHNTITSSTASVIGFDFGFLTTEFLICFMILMIIAIDSVDLRQKISNHAKIINKIYKKKPKLRTKIGHSNFEMLGGLGLGALIGFCMSKISQFV